MVGRANSYDVQLCNSDQGMGRATAITVRVIKPALIGGNQQQRKRRDFHEEIAMQKCCNKPYTGLEVCRQIKKCSRSLHFKSECFLRGGKRRVTH